MPPFIQSLDPGSGSPSGSWAPPKSLHPLFTATQDSRHLLSPYDLGEQTERKRQFKCSGRPRMQPQEMIEGRHVNQNLLSGWQFIPAVKLAGNLCLSFF